MRERKPRERALLMHTDRTTMVFDPRVGRPRFYARPENAVRALMASGWKYDGTWRDQERCDACEVWIRGE